MRKTRRGKVMISRRALIQRINRKLARDGARLKAYREGLKHGAAARWWSDLGAYYTIDLNSNRTVHTHVDLEAFGRELEVIAAYEAVEEES